MNTNNCNIYLKEMLTTTAGILLSPQVYRCRAEGVTEERIRDVARLMLMPSKAGVCSALDPIDIVDSAQVEYSVLNKIRTVHSHTRTRRTKVIAISRVTGETVEEKQAHALENFQDTITDLIASASDSTANIRPDLIVLNSLQCSRLYCEYS